MPAGAAEQDAALKSFLEGVTMTERELLNVLERHGIKRIQPINEPFNPHLHQAVMEIQRTDVPAGTVVQVFQAGFIIEDRVLRPAMVAWPRAGRSAAQAPDGSASPAAPPPANHNPPRLGQACKSQPCPLSTRALFAAGSKRSVPWPGTRAISAICLAFEVSSKRRRSFPSESHVKRGDRVVHGDVELTEKLGRSDLCPCGSGRRFQAVLPEGRTLRRFRCGTTTFRPKP